MTTHRKHRSGEIYFVAFTCLDVPTTGFSLERSFMHSNSYGTLSDHLDIHGGALYLGIHRVYDLRSPNVETKIGGGYGTRAIIGIDANYELSIK